MSRKKDLRSIVCLLLAACYLLCCRQAKTACILFAVDANERWSTDGITLKALNPRAILTNLQIHVGGKLRSAPELHKTP